MPVSIQADLETLLADDERDSDPVATEELADDSVADEADEIHSLLSDTLATLETVEAPYDEKEKQDITSYLSKTPQESIFRLLEKELATLCELYKIDAEAVDIPDCCQETIRLAQELGQKEIPSKYKGATTFLRICLRRVLYLKYKLTFEIDGRVKIRKSSQKLPSFGDQKFRHNSLIEAKRAALTSPGLQKRVVEITRTMVTLRTPAPIFSRTIEETTEAEALNDLAINYFFWLLEEKINKNDAEKLAAYLSIFGENSFESVYERLNKIGHHDQEKYANTPQQVADVYEKLEQELITIAPQHVQEYLTRARFNDLSGKKVMRQKTADPSLRRFKNAEEHLTQEITQIQIAKSHLEQIYGSRYAIMAACGNNTARTNMTLTYLPFAKSTSKRRARRQDPADIIDINQEAFTALNRTVSFYEVRLGHLPMTYFSFWIKQATGRYIDSSEVVRIPVHAQQVVRFIKKNLATLGHEKTRELAHERFPNQTTLINNCLKGETLTKPFSLDAPPKNDDDAPQNLLDTFCPEGTDYADHVFFSMLSSKEQSEKLIRAIDTLPPFDSLFIKIKFGLIPPTGITIQTTHNEDIPLSIAPLTLHEMTRYMLITRERVRQIGQAILKRLIGGINEEIDSVKPDEDDNEDPSEEYQKSVWILIDEKGFNQYCEEKKLSPEEKIYLELLLGLRHEMLYRRVNQNIIKLFFAHQGIEFPGREKNLLNLTRIIARGHRVGSLKFLKEYDINAAYTYASQLFTKATGKNIHTQSFENLHEEAQEKLQNSGQIAAMHSTALAHFVNRYSMSKDRADYLRDIARAAKTIGIKLEMNRSDISAETVKLNLDPLLRQMEDPLQTVMRLFLFFGYTHEAIAKHLQLDPLQVKTYISIGHKALQKLSESPVTLVQNIPPSREVPEKQKTSPSMSETPKKDIVKALKLLPEGTEKTVLEQHLIEGNTWQSIAESTGLSVAQVMSIHTKGVRSIQNTLRS